MARILIVHGIGNTFGGEMELRGPWYRALCDGLLRVRHDPLPAETDCYGPFYGDLFPHVVQWEGAMYLEDGLHRALRAALQQRHQIHARVLVL